MRYTDFIVTERGDLHIQLTKEGQDYLFQQRFPIARWTDAEIFLELIDEQLMQDWHLVPPDQVRTSSQSILLTREIQFDKHGSILSIGAVYWYPRCNLESYIETLQHTGSLIFEKGN